MRRISSAHFIALIALFVALGGTSIAAVALQRGSVKGKHIAKNAITSPKVSNGSLRARDFPVSELPKGDKGEKGDKGDPGEPGAPGPAGDANVVARGVTKTGVVAMGTTIETSSCEPGERVTGGGVRVDSLGYSSYRIVESHPGGGTPPTTWTAAIYSTVSKEDASIRVFVMCAA
jgi:hypothetical protein